MSPRERTVLTPQRDLGGKRYEAAVMYAWLWTISAQRLPHQRSLLQDFGVLSADHVELGRNSILFLPSRSQGALELLNRAVAVGDRGKICQSSFGATAEHLLDRVAVDRALVVFNWCCQQWSTGHTSYLLFSIWSLIISLVTGLKTSVRSAFIEQLTLCARVGPCAHSPSHPRPSASHP